MHLGRVELGRCGGLVGCQLERYIWQNRAPLWTTFRPSQITYEPDQQTKVAPQNLNP